MAFSVETGLRKIVKIWLERLYIVKREADNLDRRSNGWDFFGEIMFLVFFFMKDYIYGKC